MRWPLLEVRVLRTADFACSRSGRASTRFGDFFFLRDFGIGDGLLNRRRYDASKLATAALHTSDPDWGRTLEERNSPIVGSQRVLCGAWNFQVPSLTFVRSIVGGGELLCRGLGSRWFTERFHGNALVTDFQDDQVFHAARRLKNHAVARCGLDQRAR